MYSIELRYFFDPKIGHDVNISITRDGNDFYETLRQLDSDRIAESFVELSRSLFSNIFANPKVCEKNLLSAGTELQKYGLSRQECLKLGGFSFYVELDNLGIDPTQEDWQFFESTDMYQRILKYRVEYEKLLDMIRQKQEQMRLKQQTDIVCELYYSI